MRVKGVGWEVESGPEVARASGLAVVQDSEKASVVGSVIDSKAPVYAGRVEGNERVLGV